MRDDQYRALFNTLLNGMMHARVLLDGPAPHDFLDLEVNDAHGALTGLKDVVGKAVCQLLARWTLAPARRLRSQG